MSDEVWEGPISSYTNEEAIADGIKVAIVPGRIFATTNVLQQIVSPLARAYDLRLDKEETLVEAEAEVVVRAGPDRQTRTAAIVKVWLIEDGDGLHLIAPEDY